MKISIVRGAYANKFELQNYEPLTGQYDIEVIASRRPLTPISLSTKKLWSPHDLPDFPYKRQVLNRLLGDAHWLLGLEHAVVGADIVHVAETHYAYTHQAIEIKKRGAIKFLVSTVWETIPHNNEKFARRRRWKKDAIQHIDAFIVPTARARDSLLTEGADRQKIHLIPMGVDLDRFRPVKRQTGKRLTVLFVGRLVPEKGLDLILAVARLLPELDFVLVGRGRVGEGLPSNVTIKNYPYSRIHEAYQQADIFLFPSRTTATWEEQYGMALVEAMASGLPILAAESGAIPEVLGSTGLLFAENAVDDLVEKLSSLQSPSLRRALARRARARAESRYDCHQTAARIAAVYNNLHE